MGLDVMSRSVRVRRYALSSSPSPSVRSRSLDPEKSMSDAYNKTLTPNRKHHKLLKDGSEVWSEDIEKIFVDGLKQYWVSPWATYSRGRSRWRNQFLVEHLKKNGVERTKKQVASHIQVLRNMWRGEPEFHLVAGGEELFQDNGLLASPNDKGSPDSMSSHKNLSPTETTSTSSSSDLPSMSDFASHPLDAMSLAGGPSSLRMGTSYGAAPSLFPGGSSSSLAAALGTPPPSPHTDRIRAPIMLEPLNMGTGLFTLPSDPHSGYLSAADVSVYTPVPHNRVLGLSLWTDGMPVFTMDVDRLSAHMTIAPHSPQLPSILLRTRISIPAIDDIHSSHGIFGAITFSSRWQTEAKCITTLYCGQSCLNQEVQYLDGHETTHIFQPDALTPQSVTCTLPESVLSRCRWLESSQDLITQQIVIDGVILAAFVYHLERTVASGNAPSAELIGCQRYRPTVRRRTTSLPVQRFTPPRSPNPQQAAVAAASSSATAYFPSSYTTSIMPQTVAYAHPQNPVAGTGVPSHMGYGMAPHLDSSAYGSKSPALGQYFPTP